VTSAGEETFAFRSVAPGTYRLHAWKAGSTFNQIEYLNPQVLANLARSGTRLEVPSAATVQVQLHVPSEVSK
jgi:hypothetical protein